MEVVAGSSSAGGPARILVVNAGSTSLKLHAVEADDTAEPVESLEALPDGIEAVAHRVVHGGARFREPVVIDAAVRDEVHALEPLAPLHNAPALRGIEEAQQVLPDVPHVAERLRELHAGGAYPQRLFAA